MKFLPSAGIRRADGEALIEKMAAGEMDAEVTIEMETKIRRSSMVAVDIKGKSDSFVLVSGHYDSWYEGITDNAVKRCDPFRVCESALCTSVGIKAWSTDRMVVRSFRCPLFRIDLVL